MMKRRDLLKNLGLGAGYVVVAPSVFSLLQSCKNDPEWQPVFLNANNGFALTQVLDVIIPKDDTPGASELNIAQFIDSYMDKVPKRMNVRALRRRPMPLPLILRANLIRILWMANRRILKKW